MKYYLCENDILSETTTDEKEYLKAIIREWKVRFNKGGRFLTTEDARKSFIIAPEALPVRDDIQELTAEEAQAFINERLPDRDPEINPENPIEIITPGFKSPVLSQIENYYYGYAQNHSGNVSTTETWTLANSPHHITANLTITGTGKVIGEAGIEILVDGIYYIRINNGGELDLKTLSTPSTEIAYKYFNDATAVGASINYLWLDTGSIIRLKHVHLSHQGSNFYFNNYTGGTFDVSYCHFDFCSNIFRTGGTTTCDVSWNNCRFAVYNTTTSLSGTIACILRFNGCTFNNFYGFAPTAIAGVCTSIFTDCWLDRIPGGTIGDTFELYDSVIVGSTTFSFSGTITNHKIKRNKFCRTTSTSMLFGASANGDIENNDFGIYGSTNNYAVSTSGRLLNNHMHGVRGAGKLNIDLTPDGNLTSTNVPPMFNAVSSMAGMRATPNFSPIPSNVVVSGVGANQATISWDVGFKTQHKVYIGTASGVYDECHSKRWLWSNYTGKDAIMTKTPSFTLTELKPRQKYYFKVASYNWETDDYEVSAEGNFTTTEYYLLNELELSTNKVVYSSTSGEVMQINGQIKTDYSTIGASVSVVIRKKSDDSLVATIFSGSVDFTANVAKTMTQINGGVQMTWTTAVDNEYYVQLTIVGGTPTILAGIENQVEAEFDYVRTDDPVITNAQLSDYSINEGEATEASCNATNVGSGEVHVEIKNKLFKLSYDAGSGKYKATIYGFQIGVGAAMPVEFSANNDYYITNVNAPSNLTVSALTDYDIAAIEAQIVSILSTITDLKTVLDYEPKQIPQLPALTLFFDGFDQSQTEAVSFTITYKWIMRLYVRLHDAELCQDEMKNLTKQILSKLKVNMRLNNFVLLGIIPTATVGALLDKNNPVMIVEFSLTALREED